MKNPKYTHLFIDFDDTLYDTRGNNSIALRELYELRSWSNMIPDFDAFVTAYWTTNEDVWARYTRKEMTRDVLIVERFRRPILKCCLPGTDTSWLTDDFCREVSDQYLDLCSCKPGTVEGAHHLMQYLRNEGYHMSICSNGFHEVQYKKLQASDMLQYFDHIILSEDAGENKPGKGFFDYALHITGADKDSTLMIGDNYNTDILGALGYGLDAIWFNRWNVQKDMDSHILLTTDKLSQIQEML